MQFLFVDVAVGKFVRKNKTICPLHSKVMEMKSSFLSKAETDCNGNTTEMSLKIPRLRLFFAYISTKQLAKIHECTLTIVFYIIESTYLMHRKMSIYKKPNIQIKL